VRELKDDFYAIDQNPAFSAPTNCRARPASRRANTDRDHGKQADSSANALVGGFAATARDRTLRAPEF